MLASYQQHKIDNTLALLQGKHIDTSFEEQLSALSSILGNATETLLLASFVVIDDSVKDVAERLCSDESKFAAKVLLEVSKLDFDPDMKLWSEIASTAGRLNAVRQGLLRGPLSPLRIADPATPLRDDIAHFHNQLKEFGLLVQSWKFLSNIN